MSYYLSKELALTFEEAIPAVIDALSQEGFGILTDIDVKATLKTKLGVEFRKYRILGACNPPFAHHALELERRIGLMLPCNVIVQELGERKVEVAAIDPLASMQAVGNPALSEVGAEIRTKLARVIDSLGAG